MAYAAWTKGTAALAVAIRAFARAEGVEDVLLGEWAQSQPALTSRSRDAARSALAKGWRWVAEMEEISASFTAAGLPGEFHQAAAEIFRRSPRATSSLAGGSGDPDEPAGATDTAIDLVVAALLTGSGGTGAPVP